MERAEVLRLREILSPVTSSWSILLSRRQLIGDVSLDITVQANAGDMPHFVCLFADPEILRRLITLLSSDVLSDAMVARGLAAIKEEWMK